MSDAFPEALQIQVTNRCNFNCQMCIRQHFEKRNLIWSKNQSWKNCAKPIRRGNRQTHGRMWNFNPTILKVKSWEKATKAPPSSLQQLQGDVQNMRRQN